jgi:hypothetical protein
MRHHTPLNYSETTGKIYDIDNMVVAIPVREDVGKHIVSCVNACAGFSDPELVIRWMKSVTVKDGYMPDFGTVLKEIEQLKAERDEMLAVLKSFPGFTDDATVGDPWAENMRKVIAKVKGGQS